MALHQHFYHPSLQMPSHKMDLHPDEECTDIESMTSSSTVTAKSTRGVQFSHVSTLYSYNKELTTSLWYSPEEEDASKLQAKLDVITYQSMAASNNNGTSKRRHAITPVGLEKSLVSRDFTKQRVLARKLVYAAVLGEQELAYRKNEEVKPDLIAAASMYHSEWSRSQAEEIGKFQATKR